MGKNKGGRPRQSGGRYPSGDLRPEGIAPALVGRMKNATIKLLLDPKLGTEVGRLSAAGILTHAQAATAWRVGEIYNKWHRLKRLRTSAKSPDFEQGFGSADLAEERMSDEQLERFEAAIKAADADWRLVDLFLTEINREVRKAVLDLCVEDRAISPGMYGHIRQVFGAFALRWGQDKDWRKKAPAVRSRSLKQTAAAIEVLQAEAPRREDPGMKALVLIARKLRPDLDADGIIKVKEVWAALRDRERFRQKGAR